MARRRKPPRFSPHYLQRLREEADLTQEELAERAGTTHATISRYEGREIQLTQTALDNLARALGTTRGAILDGPPRKDRK